MSRILVTGNYTDRGAYELRTPDGKPYLHIAPCDVFGIGNSIGGYFARPVKYAGQNRLALVRIGGSLMSAPPNQIARATRGEKGYILQPNFTGLWATSSGSARRGIFHRYSPPAQETDPVTRILRQGELPSWIVKEAGEPTLTTEERWYDNSHCPNGRPTNYWLTDGQMIEEASFEMEKPHGYFGGGGRRIVRIEGATYAIRIDASRYGNGLAWSKPSQVLTWPGCDREALANVLAPMLFGQGADVGYSVALEDFKAAQQWVAEKFSIEPHPTKGDRLVVDGRDCLIAPSHLASPDTLRGLLKAHGLRLIEPHLGPVQHHFQRAEAELAEAVSYILAHYRVVAVTRGEERGLKFGVPERPEELGPTGSVYFGFGPELPLQRLLDQYKAVLRDSLWSAAPERLTLVSAYPSTRRFRLRDRVWEVHRDWEGEYVNDDFRPVASEADAVQVSLHDPGFAGALTCLSGSRRSRGRENFGDVLAEGDDAYGDAYSVLLPIRKGEVKNFVFFLYSSWGSSDGAVWGVTVRRSEAGVDCWPYDNGKRYNCWSNEVSVASLVD